MRTKGRNNESPDLRSQRVYESEISLANIAYLMSAIYVEVKITIIVIAARDYDKCIFQKQNCSVMKMKCSDKIDIVSRSLYCTVQLIVQLKDICLYYEIINYRANIYVHNYDICPLQVLYQRNVKYK